MDTNLETHDLSRPSKVSIGRRTEKTPDNQYGWVRDIKNVNVDMPCILVLGGDGSTTDRTANGYAKHITNLLKSNNIHDVNVYSVVYDYGHTGTGMNSSFDRGLAMNNLIYQFNQGQSKLQEYNERWQKFLTPDTINPQFVQQIFDVFILPRICDSAGKKYAPDIAAKNIRNLNIVAHCMGGYVFLKLEELMQQKMQELGYTAPERKQIQSQLLCVAHAPYCPLGVSKSTMISFVSAWDGTTYHENIFNKYIRRFRVPGTPGNLKFCFFPGRRGNFFLVPRYYNDNDEYNTNEHVFTGGSLHDTMTRDGKYANAFECYAIISGVKSALAGTPLPDVKNLICDNRTSREKVFDMVVKNGNEMYSKMCNNIKFMKKIDNNRLK